MTTKTHNSNEISSSFAGRSFATGRAEGDFCTTEYTKELHTLKVGADGEVTRVRSNDRSAKITLKFMSTSDGHKLMLQLYLIALNSPNGQDIGTFQLRDRNGGLVEHAEEAWIAKAPANAFGADVGEREWELHCAELVREVEVPV
jgi:hypothetical protein